MSVVSRVSTRAIPDTQTNVLSLKTILSPKAIALFCALALGASLCLATYGLDLSAGFF
jgi:hypothetical protein